MPGPETGPGPEGGPRPRTESEWEDIDRRIEELYRLRDRQVEEKFGRETLDEMKHTSEGIYHIMEDRILEIGEGPGSSSQQKEHVREYLDMWRGFINSTQARTEEGGKTSSHEHIDMAVAAAYVMIAPWNEFSPRVSDLARKSIELLEKRDLFRDIIRNRNKK